jgi:hypothetical protein
MRESCDTSDPAMLCEIFWGLNIALVTLSVDERLMLLAHQSFYDHIIAYLEN